ncbi:hypothetical protein N431DRAFT_454287 [Stipitochalara longipes BDJ]|nr:hypothetical protein N431DRAFT_454287 [Stipitochalara longipes BDJ]
MFARIPERRAVDKSFDMRTFYPYEDIRHFACLHPADSVDLRNSTDAWDMELLLDDDVPILFGGEKFTALLHPRWCPSCLARRTALLNQSLIKRLERIDLFTKVEAIRRTEKAYVCGVIKGRVDALITALEENEQVEHPEDDTEDVDMLSETPAAALIEGDEQLLGAAETGDVQGLIHSMFEARLTEGDEELAALMNKLGVSDVEIEADELHLMLEVELELALITDRVEQQGVEDGRRLQARLEGVAMSLDDMDTRGELFEQALF